VKKRKPPKKNVSAGREPFQNRSDEAVFGNPHEFCLSDTEGGYWRGEKVVLTLQTREKGEKWQELRIGLKAEGKKRG